SVLGRRPAASNTWLATPWAYPDSQSTETATPSGCRARRVHSARVRTAIPSFSRIAWISADTTGSPRRTTAEHLHDRHFGAEAAIHLCKLEAYVAAANDDEMARYLSQGQHVRARKPRH